MYNFQEQEGGRTFGPCIETPNPTAFITKKPIDIITSGQYNKVPMMIGFNSNEGLVFFMSEIVKNKKLSREIVYERFIPPQMNLPLESPLRKEITDKLRKVYSNDTSGDIFLVSIALTKNH